jgi:hypothetical protein
MVTALGDVNTTSARILQTDAPVYTMALQVGTTDFTSSASLLKHFTALSLAVLGLLLIRF